MIASWQLAALMIDRTDIDNVDSQRLPLLVCAWLAGLLPAVPVLANIRQAVADRLQAAAKSPAGLEAYELAAVMDGLKACRPSAIDGKLIARLAVALVGAETSVGGPYCRTGARLEVTDNAWIAQCIARLAAPLPKVWAYLNAELPDLEIVEDTDLALWAALHAADDSLARRELEPHLALIVQALCWHIVFKGLHHVDSARTVQQKMVQQIHDYSFELLPQFSQPFDGYTRRMLSQVITADANHEISQLAWYFGDALTWQASAQPELYIRLGAANLYAWAAYTIYDDFLDEEGQPPMLGTANYSLRAMLYQYQSALSDPAYGQFVEHALATVDQANALETSQFRLVRHDHMLVVDDLPDFGDCSLLADRALFHILGPMAILRASGRAEVGDEAWQAALQAFRHYLIARQLNDDIHDWAKDLQAGQATYVVVELLRYLNLSQGYYPLAHLLPHARRQFWQYVLPSVCDTALYHIYQARACLKRSVNMTANNHIDNLFDYVEQSMRAAQEKRADSQLLLRTFRLSGVR